MRKLSVVWIVFNDKRIFHTFNDVAYSDGVRRNFIVSMGRHSYFASTLTA